MIKAQNPRSILSLATLVMATAFAISLSIGCRMSQDEGKGSRIARVFDQYLYEKDLEGIYGQSLSAADSAMLRKAFIDKWIQDQLLAAHAEKNLSHFEDELDSRVAEYRNSMLTFYFEKEYASQQLDTLVSDEEIREYYENNKENFLLTDNIIKVSFVKLPLKAPNLKQVREYLQSGNPQDEVRLRDYCERSAENYFIDNDSWLLFDDLLREIPIKTYNQEAYLMNNRFVEFEDSLFRYMVHIKGFRVKESVSPLSFETGNIQDIILNKRKLEIIERLRNDIVRKGVKDKSFELYEE